MKHLKRDESNIRILVVEDGVMNQQVMGLILKQLGLSCDFVSNGLEALDILETKAYDLVFMDCVMPEMDGYAATQELRRREEKSEQKTLIVAMTAKNQPEDRDKCLAAGMNDYISKPIQVKEVQRVLEQFLASEKIDFQKQDSDSSQEIVDFECLKRVSGGDKSIEYELLSMFVKDTAMRLNTLEETIAQRNIAGLKNEAHGIKGAAANVGALTIQEISEFLELVDRDSPLEQVQDAIQRLKVELSKTKKVYESYLRSP